MIPINQFRLVACIIVALLTSRLKVGHSIEKSRRGGYVYVCREVGEQFEQRSGHLAILRVINVV